MADLASEIRLCNDWDRGKLRSPEQPVTAEPKRLDSSIPRTGQRNGTYHSSTRGRRSGRPHRRSDRYLPRLTGELDQKTTRHAPSNTCHQQTTCRRQKAHIETSNTLNAEGILAEGSQPNSRLFWDGSSTLVASWYLSRTTNTQPGLPQ